jgi:AP2-like factor, ANT lineage
MTSNNSSCSTGGSDAAAGGWLGFSLSPHHMASVDAAADDGGASNGVQQQYHAGLYYPSPVSSSPAPYCYALGSGGHESVVAQARSANNAGGAFYPALPSMPLRSDGSLCISEAVRRSEDEMHHGKLY